MGVCRLLIGIKYQLKSLQLLLIIELSTIYLEIQIWCMWFLYQIFPQNKNISPRKTSSPWMLIITDASMTNFGFLIFQGFHSERWHNLCCRYSAVKRALILLEGQICTTQSVKKNPQWLSCFECSVSEQFNIFININHTVKFAHQFSTSQWFSGNERPIFLPRVI